MANADNAPACPRCGVAGMPSDPDDPVVEDFPWTCPQCGTLYVGDDTDENLLEEPEARLLATISDMNGRTYPVFGAGDADWYDITIRDEQAVAAAAGVSWRYGDTLMIAQLSVSGPYRERGLAVPLIGEIITLACRQGIAMIRGVVVHTELEDSPELLNWYERSGFDIALASVEGEVVASIERRIAPTDC